MAAIGIQSFGLVGCGVCNYREFLNRLFNDGIGVPGFGVGVLESEPSRWSQSMDKRLLRKIDRFSALALYAAEQCLRNNTANFTLDSDSGKRLGLAIGNNYGGWGYVEPQMEGLYQSGMDAITPYVATAWFPAAAQGEISIKLGIKGHSKTLAAERLSAGYAVEYARTLLESKQLDAVLAGGAEAPLTPIVLAAMRQAGLTDGTTPAGEAACLLFLSRDVGHSPAAIGGIGRGADAFTAMRKALADVGCATGEIDAVLLDKPRSPSPQAYLEQVQGLRRLALSGCPVALVMPFGETVGASYAVSLLCACAMLDCQRLPASDLAKDAAEFIATQGQALAESGAAGRLQKVLVVGSDEFGQWLCMVVAKTALV